MMTRVVLDPYWVTLARADGTTTRLGVTSEHPMFVVGQGWTPAGEVGAGDKIRDAALGELLVLSAELDSTPRRVHNLEVADAHTYFAGDFEAWGHNSKWGQRIALIMQLGSACVDDNGTLSPSDDEIVDFKSGELDPEGLPREPGTKPNKRRPRSCPFKRERSRITKFLIENLR